jgi:hypothetical protein
MGGSGGLPGLPRGVRIRTPRAAELALDELGRYRRAGRAWNAALGDGVLVDGRYGPPVPGGRSFSTRWNNRWSRQAPSM